MSGQYQRGSNLVPIVKLCRSVPERSFLTHYLYLKCHIRKRIVLICLLHSGGLCFVCRCRSFKDDLFVETN